MDPTKAKPKILALDDNRLPLRILSQIFKADFDFVGFKTIHEIESYIEGCGGIDLVLVDIQLSGGENGLDFVRRFRKKSRFANVPIIVVSSVLDNTVITEASRVGVNDWISKPVSKPDILERVSEILKKPYFRKPELNCDRIPVMSWTVNNQYFQFSPHIQWTASGETPEEAKRKMYEKLQESIASGSIDFINFKIIEHELFTTNPLQ